MTSPLKTQIVRIGNSKGIRLPKTILEQCHLKDQVELLVEGNRLIICSANAPRSGWNNAFADMAARGDDGLLDKDSEQPTEWDKNEWHW